MTDCGKYDKTVPFLHDSAAGRCRFDLLSDGQTEKVDAIHEEIEFLKVNYDTMTVQNDEDSSSSYPTLRFHIDPEGHHSSRVDLVVQFVAGYPYVAPRVSLFLPRGVNPNDDGAFSARHATLLQEKVKDVVQATIVSGAPCVMQIVSAAEEVVCCASVEDEPKPQTPPPPPAPEKAQKTLVASESAAKAKETLRLGVLALHLLNKCCQLRDHDSREEAMDNFSTLASYLLKEVKVFPPKAALCLPWKPDVLKRAFDPFVMSATTSDDVLKRWLWNDDSAAFTLQPSSIGRYQNEFIEQRMLGAGGFAPVFVCRKKVDGRLYAIKKIVMRTKESERTLREVQTLAALDHKNIVRYYDAWIEPGCDPSLQAFLEDDEEEEDEEEEDEEEGDDEYDSDDDLDLEIDRSTGRVGNGNAGKNGAHHASKALTDGRGNGGGHEIGQRRHDKKKKTSFSGIPDGLALPPSVAQPVKIPQKKAMYNRFFSDSDIDDDDDDDENARSESASSDESTSSEELNTHSRPTESAINTPYLASTEKYHTLYIQMELCSARSLRHLIDNADACVDGADKLFGADMGEKLAASILRQLLTVVSHVHRENIVHRDLKPDNILFEMKESARDDFGTIRVADFGLARTMAPSMRHNRSTSELDDDHIIQLEAHQAGMPIPTGNLGSVLYCAPEQERGEFYDFKVDEYSIGMVALEMWLAIAGKGFRERFNILSEVARGGKLPTWFQTWNPNMAGIIQSLIERDPSRRKSCEEILQTAGLPGEPAEITEALDTIGRYNDRIVGRVMQRVNSACADNFRRIASPFRELSKLLVQQTTSDVLELIGIVSLLHMATPLTCFDPLVLSNPEIQNLSLPFVIDSMGRSYVYPNQPHFSMASIINQYSHSSSRPGSFIHYYNRSRPLVTYATQTTTSGYDDLMLDPFLFLLHVVSQMDFTEQLELVVSHADWLNAVYPTEAGSRPPPEQCHTLKFEVKAADQIAPGISKISAELTNMKLLDSQTNYETIIHRFTTSVLEQLPNFGFGRDVSTSIVVSIDPAWRPSETVVHRQSLRYGVLFELRTLKEQRPFAVGCALDNFTHYVSNRAAISAPNYCVTMDIQELLGVVKHVKLPIGDSVVLDGVAVRRNDQYSQTHFNILDAATHLWKGNIRACLNTDRDVNVFSKSMKTRGVRFVLSDGYKYCPLRIYTQQSKGGARNESGSSETAATTFRNLLRDEKLVSRQHKFSVVYAGREGDASAADNAIELYTTMVQPTPNVVLATYSGIRAVRRCINDISSIAEGSPGTSPSLHDLHMSSDSAQDVMQWIRSNMNAIGVLPVYSISDDQLEFFVNAKRYRSKRKKDNGKKKK